MEQEKKKTDNIMRRLARLAAVQGLYQIALSREPVEALIKRFREDPAVLLQEERTVIAVDAGLFGQIMSGVMEHLESLDQMIAGALDSRLSVERLEQLLKAILRAGAFELLYNTEVPEKVILNDYVDVAHGFFDAKEPALVNAVLDSLAKNLRS
ncbi:MAG: transcription antitermination factor NusB [Alphaproteobacteria bacterium]|nr:transcription antitermination factor NusB [Alphaproteobacteria bacterium]